MQRERVRWGRIETVDLHTKAIVRMQSRRGPECFAAPAKDMHAVTLACGRHFPQDVCERFRKVWEFFVQRGMIDQWHEF